MPRTVFKNWESVPVTFGTTTCAVILGVSPLTLQKMAKNNEVPVRKVGKNYRYEKEQIRRFLEGKGVENEK